jgi:hypothetical protein
MHYIIESIIVGLYCVIIYFFINMWVSNTFLNAFFITGFLKHFLAYYLGLHSWYCNNGYSCKIIYNSDTNTKLNENKYIFIESIGEGILFLLVAMILNNVITNKYLIIFLIGFILHITFELIGIHKYFCLVSCNSKI